MLSDEVNSSAVLVDYSFIRNIVMIFRVFFSFYIVFGINKLIFFVFVMNFMVFILYNGISYKSTREKWSNLFEKVREINSYTHETLDKITSILCGNMFSTARKENLEKLLEIENINLSIERTKMKIDSIFIDIPNIISYISILFIGYRGVIEGNMNIGDLVLVWTYYSYVNSPINILKNFNRAASQSEMIVNNLSNILYNNKKETVGEINELEMYRANNLSLTHNGGKILHDIFFLLIKE